MSLEDKIYKNKQEWLEDHPEEKEKWEKQHNKKRLSVKIDEDTYEKLKEEFGNKIGKGVNTVLREYVKSVVEPEGKDERFALQMLRAYIPSGRDMEKFEVEVVIEIVKEALQCDTDRAYTVLYSLMRENFVMRNGDYIFVKRKYKMPSIEGQMMMGGGMFG